MNTVSFRNKLGHACTATPESGGTLVTTVGGRSMHLDIPFTDFVDGLANWVSHRMLIQNALPGLNADEREFLMTGMTPEEWGATFPEDS